MKNFVVAGHLAALIGGLIFSGAALAQSTWNWGEVPGCDPSTCTVGGVTATVYGYGAEAGSTSFLKGSVRDVDPSGLGVTSKDNSTTSGARNNENTNSPNHAIDNFKGSSSSSSSDSSYGGAAYAEVLAIHFDKAVSLTQVATAWTYNDSDAMIFRWDGGSLVPTDPLNGFKPSDLPTTGIGTPTGTSNGWTLVAAGQFGPNSTSGGGSNNGSLSFSSSLYSSYWLVSTALGQTNGDANNDGFKVSSFTGNVCKNGNCNPTQTASVPEPASLALAATGLLGLTFSRRRTKRT